MSDLQPRYPIYVISKGRWQSRYTSKTLERMGVPYRIVIEPQELEQYAAVIDPAKILTLPFSNLGQGSIPARNWIWEHSISEGHARHWILDDNIHHFFRFNYSEKIRVRSASIFAAMEDFTERYENVPMSGPQYRGFVHHLHEFPPFIPNARVYSCLLLSNAIPHRWRGRYNEDTDLSLRILKDGYCTILFQAFLAGKQATMTVRGGNTDELYRQDDTFDGRLEMAKSLQEQHPDVVTIRRRWGRWQHVVDYRPFRANRFIRRAGLEIPDAPNEYGMRLVTASA